MAAVLLSVATLATLATLATTFVALTTPEVTGAIVDILAQTVVAVVILLALAIVFHPVLTGEFLDAVGHAVLLVYETALSIAAVTPALARGMARNFARDVSRFCDDAVAEDGALRFAAAMTLTLTLLVAVATSLHRRRRHHETGETAAA